MMCIFSTGLKPLATVLFVVFSGHDPVFAGEIANGSFVRITQTGGFSPYTKVVYDVTVRQETALFTLNKDMNCYKGQLQKVQILPLEAAAEIFRKMENVRHKLPKEEMKQTEGIVFEIWYSLDEFYGKAKVGAEFLIENVQTLEFVNLVRDTVTEKTGGIPFRNLFFSPEKFGFLTVYSKNKGKIRISELGEDFEIPVTLIEMPAGVYNAEIVFRGGESKTVKKVFIIDSGLETFLEAE